MAESIQIKTLTNSKKLVDDNTGTPKEKDNNNYPIQINTVESK